MEKNIGKLTLLHSNDMHGDFESEKIDDDLVGGVSRLSGYVEKIRREEKNVIYAIAGDMFRGSVIDSEYKGVSTIDIMNALAPDVVTIGNHEMDYGIAHLLFIEKCARFPIINANLHIKSNGVRLFTPCMIIRRGGLRILFIGIVTEEVLAAAKSDDIGALIDTAAAAEEVGRICNSHNGEDIDFTVLLTHIGIEEDRRLAAMLKPEWGVDAIVGGHSHTLMDEPEIVNGIAIVQAHTGTDSIGRFDLEIDRERNCISSYKWEFVPINDKTAPRNPQIEKILTKYKDQTDAKYNRVITHFSAELTHPVRYQETSLGNLFADIFMESLGIDIMLLGSGSVRADKMGPIVTYGDLVAAFPYDDEIYKLSVSGAQLRQMIGYMQREEAFTGHTEYYQLSRGVELAYSRSKKDFIKFKFNGEEIEDDRIYTVGLQTFHYNNFEDNFDISLEEISANAKPKIIATSCVEIIEEYMASHSRLSSKVDGRNTVIE